MTKNRKELYRKLIATYPAADEQGQLYWIAEYRKVFA